MPLNIAAILELGEAYAACSEKEKAYAMIERALSCDPTRAQRKKIEETKRSFESIGV